MKNWELVDYSQPFEEDHDFPRVVIHSESHLREQLTQRRQRRPGVYHFAGPIGDSLLVTIGGRFAGLDRVTPPKGNSRISAVPRAIRAEAPVVFLCEGLENTYDPEYLFPVEEVIDAIVYFYQTHRVPEWLDWRYWNGDTKQWETKRGSGAPPTASVQAGPQPAPSLVCPGCTAVTAPREEEARQEVCPRCGEPVVR